MSINTVEQLEHGKSKPVAKRNPIDRIILWVAGHFGNKAKEVERFLKFVMVGTMGAAVDFTTLFILTSTIFRPVEPFVRLKVIMATTFAFLAAITSNFIWNRFWTYPDSRSRSVRRQMAQFTFVNTVGWGARTLWISLTFAAIGAAVTPTFITLRQSIAAAYVPGPGTEAKVGAFVAQFIGLWVVMVWNFFANRYWTYNDVD